MNEGVELTLIAAVAANGAIGRHNQLPWPRLKGDFAFVQHLTTRQPTGLIMGRRTFDSIGRVLPGRVSLVITSQKGREPVEESGGAAIFFSSLAAAVAHAVERSLLPVIFGGETVYSEALANYPCQVYLTKIQEEYKGDRFFPLEFLRGKKEEVITEEVSAILQAKGAPQTWTESPGHFHENSITYQFVRILLKR